MQGNDYVKFLYDRLEKSRYIDTIKEMKKYELLEDGLELVEENKREELKICFLNYGDDIYSICIFKSLILCLRKLQNGVEIQDIIKLFETIRLSPFMIREISNLIIYFSPRGEEFKNYMYSIMKLTEEEKELYFSSSYLMGKELEERNRK